MITQFWSKLAVFFTFCLLVFSIYTVREVFTAIILIVGIAVILFLDEAEVQKEKKYQWRYRGH